MTKLAPCPFCGGEVKCERPFLLHMIRCNECGMLVSFDPESSNVTPDAAIAKYNRRVYPNPFADFGGKGIVEKLKS